MKMLDTKSFIQSVNISNGYVIEGIITGEDAEILKRLCLLNAFSSSLDDLIQHYIMRSFIKQAGGANEQY
jgi:hypothetical protein